MRRCFAILGLILAAGVLVAGVPNRIIYQGRLFKSGVGISGEKSIRLTLVKADGKTVVDTKSFSVSLPATGEFTIVWDLEKEIDWRGDQPELKVEVDTDELTPRQQFSASPYAFVAKRVEVGAVDTLSIADGAVTSAKISAGGIEADKINLANGKTLNSWVAPNGKIMADGIEGKLSTTADHATKHEKGGEDELRLDPSQVDGVLVAHSTYTQVIQPTANEPALAVKGNPRSGSDVLQIYDSAETPVKQVSFDKDGNMVSNRSILASGVVSAGGAISTSKSLTADSAIVKNKLSALYDGATTDFSASLGWNSLQLGNNGYNYIVAGRTNSGGGLKFVVNNKNDYSHGISPDGVEAVTINNDGKVGIGSSNPTEKLEVAGRVKDKTGFLVPVGTVVAFAGISAPEGWLLCDGALHSRATYPELSAVLASTYGGDPSNFRVPDLRGRTAVGSGTGAGLSARNVGQWDGAEKVTLTTAEMPTHNHGLFRETNHSVDRIDGLGRVDRYSTVNADGRLTNRAANGIDNAGGGQPHNNMPPFLVLNYIIKY